jgi:type IV pilus assembly protein PilY1
MRAIVGAVTLLAAAFSAGDGHADMDEAWLHRAPLPVSVRPLLALILDRSAAAGGSLPVGEDYDPLRDYASGPDLQSCDPGKAYFRRGAGPAPDCARQRGLDLVPRDSVSGLHCESARAALARAGFYVASRAAQWRAGPDGGYWDALGDESTGPVECRADRGRHGSAAGEWYAGEGAGVPWIRDGEQEIPWDRSPFADPYILYTGNYLNYLRANLPASERPLAEVMSRRLAQALASTSEIDVALVRVDDDGPDGGYVARAPVASDLAAVEVLAMADSTPAGDAPLAETLTEAARWLAGGPRQFGFDARTDSAALDPRAATTYWSPFGHACRPVSLAYLSAGVPSGDEEAAAAANSLPRFQAESGGCGADCLAAVGAWLGTTDLRDDLPGTQSAPVSWILPSESAASESGSFADPLSYVNLVANAHQRDAAVAAGPALSAAALMPFGIGASTPGVIFGLSAPRPNARWLGNALKYALRAPAGPFEPPLVVDRDGEPAIDANGLPGAGTRSLWSDAPDANLLAGGAAGRLPIPGLRNVYTDVADDRLTDPANRLEPGNTSIGRETIGLRALDPESSDGILESFLALRTLGDPGLRAVSIVDYPQAGFSLAYAATQDGVLHAFDAESGVEQWAWMPRELLGRLPALVRNATTTVRSHGLDGALVVHRHDPDGDGRIEPASGEHLWLLFGLGRGGSRYYALDVALPREPRLLWSQELPSAPVLSLAEPVVARLEIADSGQDTENWVVLLAGGYDRRFDASAATGSGRGNSILAVDATTGRRLWSAGGGGDDLAIDGLSSVAAAPRLLDLDGDGRIDRAYVLDVVGNLWRMDFESGRDAASLASAHRLARLDTAGRRFLFTPDASIVRSGMKSRLAIAIGSGSLMRPRDAAAQDAVFVVYDEIAGTTVGDLQVDDLYDATHSEAGIPPDAPGWLVRLDAHDEGERVAGPIVTFDHVLRFQTYQPLPVDPAAPCGPPPSAARHYALDIRTALPRATVVESEEEEPEEIVTSGLPPGLKFGFPGRWDDACAGCKPRPFGILGGEPFDTGYAGDPVRTSWRKLVPPPASP